MQKINWRQLAGIGLASVLAITTASAQTPPQSPQTPKPAEQTAQRAAAEPLGQPTNIKLDITITDQTGPGEALKKVVTMVVADRGNGSIRSTGSVRAQGRVQINVDAYPTIVQNGAIRLRLGLEYNPRTLASDGPTEWSSLNEQISVILDAGKPMVISQAADPASDRKIMVEVRATLLK
jgi:hypothetical protein